MHPLNQNQEPLSEIEAIHRAIFGSLNETAPLLNKAQLQSDQIAELDLIIRHMLFINFNMTIERLSGIPTSQPSPSPIRPRG